MRQTRSASERNKQPIAEVLATVLPARGTVLEVASGTGQHVAHLAATFTDLDWQPTDVDEGNFPSIQAWCEGRSNVREPMLLDAASPSWPMERTDVVFNCNMVHIAPWAACEGLLAGAGRVLPIGGALIIYGPYFVAGEPRGPGNVAFDERLRAEHPEWGIRELDDVVAAATAHGLELERTIAMPANNLTCIYRRT